MKKILIYITILIVFLCSIPRINTFADGTYARVESSTNLYKTPNDTNNINDVYCIAEKSYFVQIITDNGNNYKVNYNGQIGFIKKNDVKIVNNQPTTPFPSNIKIVIGNTCNLRSTPTTQSLSNNILTTLNAEENNITFIGRIFAEEAIDFGGTTWYYVKYKDYTGYVYNKYIKSITPIYENIEEVSYYVEKFNPQSNPLKNTPSLIIVILLFIPTIVIIFILYSPQRLPKSKNKRKQVNSDNF